MDVKTYGNVDKLFRELQAYSLPVRSVRFTGGQYEPVYSRDLNELEKSAEAAALAAHDPVDHSISPVLVFLKGDDTHSVELVVTTDPDLATVALDIGGEELVIDLVEGVGTFDMTSDTPGAELLITGRAGALPGAGARIYVI
ncbi:MAG: hypothetical protein HN350_20550 [Phycisphaerales bacterium]|jgi:hypothetical protein|nr:hypothetical protein [Phycisphaerales bacterium]